MSFKLESGVKITALDMHTGGEPLRILENAPKLIGKTILDKRTYARVEMDLLRKYVMLEPRGHSDMYGAILVDPDHPAADFGVLFMHNQGYGTMCGHGIIALGRYAVDHGIIKTVTTPVTQVNIQCPCGLVKTYVNVENGKSGAVSFDSVPAFAFSLDVEVEVEGHGKVNVDIGYGGAFYALVPAAVFGLDVRTAKSRDLAQAGDAVIAAVKAQVQLHHPDGPDLAFCYGTILTDGNDTFSPQPAANVCIFADKQVDRSPCGSGTTARLAVQFARGLIALEQTRTLECGVSGSKFTGKVIQQTTCGEFTAVIVQVSGNAYYTGRTEFIVEDEDELKEGFLIR